MPLKKEVKEDVSPIRKVLIVSMLVVGIAGIACTLVDAATSDEGTTKSWHEPSEMTLAVGDVGEFPRDYALKIADPEPFESGGRRWTNGDVCRVPKGTSFEVLNIHPSRAEAFFSYGAIVRYRDPSPTRSPLPHRLAGHPDNPWLYHDCPDGAWLYAIAFGALSQVQGFERKRSDLFERAWELAPR